MPRPFSCAANCSKSHGRVDLVFGHSAPWTEPVGTVAPLACGHAVCLECVSARPEVLKRCAQCGFSLATPTQCVVVAHSKHKPQQQVSWGPGTTDKHDDEEIAGVHPNIDVNEIACQICGSGDDEDMMVLCDDCPRGYHTYCLSPPLQQIPSGDWFCPRCSQQHEENKKRAMDRATEHWCNKRGRGATTAEAAPGDAATLGDVGTHNVDLRTANGREGSTGTADSCAATQTAPSPGTVDALRSGFVEYCRQMQPSIEREEPNRSRSAVLAKLASEWRGLSDANRRKYAAMAAKAKRQQRLTAVAAEVNGAMGGRVLPPGTAALAASSSSHDGTAPLVRPHGPVIPLFVRATRQVMEGSEHWLALTPTGEGRLAVEWRIPDAATCVIIALGWAQGRPAYVERTDNSSVLQREGVVHFTEAHIARFAGAAERHDNGDSLGESNATTIKAARPLVMRLWRDSTFGEHGARTYLPQLLQHERVILQCHRMTILSCFVRFIAQICSGDNGTICAAIFGRLQRHCCSCQAYRCRLAARLDGTAYACRKVGTVVLRP